jgi:hypothetical protein
MKPNYQIFGWTDLQWATVQSECGPFESIEDMLEAMYDWRRQNKPDPIESIEPAHQLRPIVMSSVYANCVMLSNFNGNLDALEAGHRKATDPARATRTSVYSDGGFVLGLGLGLSL